ncbi:MAG: hypothetical protein KJ967_00600 [Elusimicrobia bacterium]|nr:hypothetical protein [Elusimicrobiota bacterium]
MNTEKTKCKCPFCEHELKMNCFEPVFCQPCKIKFSVCGECGGLFNEELNSCPKCGAKRSVSGVRS